jgi:hypothetical protein
MKVLTPQVPTSLEVLNANCNGMIQCWGRMRIFHLWVDLKGGLGEVFPNPRKTLRWSAMPSNGTTVCQSWWLLMDEREDE